MSNYTEYFLASASSIIQFELIEISHPNFSQTYRIVRNSTEGLTVTLEDSTEHFFDYYPLRITADGNREDLDFGIDFDFGDLGEIIPSEIDLVAAADGFDTFPTVKYRTYRSDNLTKPLVGPVVLEVVDFSFNKEGCSFKAKARSLNVNTTGEIYKIDRFRMLRGFL